MKKSGKREKYLMLRVLVGAAVIFGMLPLSSGYAASKSLKITGEGHLLEHFEIPNPAVFSRIEMWAEIDVRWKITTLLGEPIVFCDAKWKPTTINVYGRSLDGKSDNTLLFSKFALSDDDYSRNDRNNRIDAAFNKVEMIDLEVEILSDHKASFNGISTDRGKFSCNVGVLAPAGDKYSWNIPISPDWDEFLYSGSLHGPHFKFLTPDKAKAQMKRGDGQHFERTHYGRGWRSVALAPSQYENVYVGSWDYVKVDFDFFSLRQLYDEDKAAYRAKQHEVEARERLKRASERRQDNKESSQGDKTTRPAQQEKQSQVDSQERMGQIIEAQRAKKESVAEDARIAKLQKAKREKLKKLQKAQLDKVCGKTNNVMDQCQRKICGWRPSKPLNLLSYSSWDDDCDAACKRRRERKKRERDEREKRELSRQIDRWKTCMDNAEATCVSQGLTSDAMCRADAKTVPDHAVESAADRETGDLLKSFGIKGPNNNAPPQQSDTGKKERNDMRDLLGNFGNNDGIKAGNKQPAQPKANTSSMQSILDRYNK